MGPWRVRIGRYRGVNLNPCAQGMTMGTPSLSKLAGPLTANSRRNARAIPVQLIVLPL